MDILYINVYRTTRHFGGHEEGGWYYNVGEPLASVPIPAVKVEGHDCCFRCNRTRSGEKDENGKPYTYCKIELNESEYNVRFDDIVLDMMNWQNVSNEQYFEFREAHKEKIIEIIERSLPTVFHLVPAFPESFKKHVKELEEMFEDLAEGNIYSVNGGAEIRINLEDHMAEYFPQTKPQYE